MALVRHSGPGGDAESFDRIARWVDSFERLWEARLDSLAGYLQRNETEEGQS